MTDRFALLDAAFLCGGVYAAWRVCLTLFYPAISGLLWQRVVGPAVAARWPSLAQDEDANRPSYLPLTAAKPYVLVFGLLPPPIGDVTQGIRDGLLLGVLVALLPEIIYPFLLTGLLAFVIAKNAWWIGEARGSARTDQLIYAGRELLMVVGSIASVQAVGLLMLGPHR